MPPTSQSPLAWLLGNYAGKPLLNMRQYPISALESGATALDKITNAPNNFIKGSGNLIGNIADKAGGAPDAASSALDFLTSSTGLGAGLGVVQQLMGNLMGDSETERWEKEKQNALAQTLANREGINAMNPEANRRLASMQVQNAMSGAQAGAMNAAAGQGQYSGGDVTFAAGAGARNSAMAQQAISPMAQQLAGLYGQKAQEEMGKRQMLDQNSMQQAQIRDMSAYINTSNNPLQGLVQSALAGSTAFSTAADQRNKDQYAQR